MTQKKLKNIQTLYVVLGDQLTDCYDFYNHMNRETDCVWMAEVEAESTTVWSHKARIVMFLSAMRHFKQQLGKKDIPVLYHQLDTHEYPDLATALASDIKKYLPSRVVIIKTGDYVVQQQLVDTVSKAGLILSIITDSTFLCDTATFNNWASNKKQLRMEYFYRFMRKTHSVLLEDEQPIGGKWNYDYENRRSFGKQGPDNNPPWPGFCPDKITKNVINLVNTRFPNHPGSLDHFDWPVTSEQAETALTDFIQYRLPTFGAYQDAMWTDEPFLYHSGLAAALNLKLLDPRFVINRAADAYHQRQAPLTAVEGFIRQILGWREFVRGIYWRFMPEYKEKNLLKAKLNLPDFYWTADTDMICLKQTITQSLEYGYAHHIQRLMVTGLFSLLFGVKPQAIHEWYLAIYVDAVEWVELPNTLGMSQYADGGILASKPYVASGKYIQRMSNYCRHCRYNPANAIGKDACPFTTLYWDFLQQKKHLFGNHPRTALQWRHLNRLSDLDRQEIGSQAKIIRQKLRNN